MPIFCKKPSVVEARQFKAHSFAVQYGISMWCGGEYQKDSPSGPILIIATPTGTQKAEPDDWVVRDSTGAFSVCKPDLFEQTYIKARTRTLFNHIREKESENEPEPTTPGGCG